MNPPPPPEFLKKMATNRIFSTLLYPNTLAGVILMILPPLVAALSSFGRHFTVGARRLLVAMVSLPALACLYWSGSKGGWLLMLIVVIVGALFLPIARTWKIAFGCAVLVLGLAGFAIRHANYLRRGAPSAEARVEYWRVALKIVHESPLLGTGPGTFAIPHARLKRPETEMARLTHNDYLEQACDSGIPGFLLYTALCLAVLCYTGSPPDLKRDPVRLAVWLGVLAWALQSLMEFGLYIPAISWPAFAFMGWLLGTRGGDAISNDGNGALTQA